MFVLKHIFTVRNTKRDEEFEAVRILYSLLVTITLKHTSCINIHNYYTLLQQESFCFLESFFHFSSLQGKVLPFLHHVFSCFGEFCHRRLDLLYVREVRDILKYTQIDYDKKKEPSHVERERVRPTSSRARCCDATSPNAFNSRSRSVETLWKRRESCVY